MHPSRRLPSNPQWNPAVIATFPRSHAPCGPGNSWRPKSANRESGAAFEIPPNHFPFGADDQTPPGNSRPTCPGTKCLVSCNSFFRLRDVFLKKVSWFKCKPLTNNGAWFSSLKRCTRSAKSVKRMAVHCNSPQTAEVVPCHVKFVVWRCQKPLEALPRLSLPEPSASMESKSFRSSSLLSQFTPPKLTALSKRQGTPEERRAIPNCSWQDLQQRHFSAYLSRIHKSPVVRLHSVLAWVPAEERKTFGRSPS